MARLIYSAIASLDGFTADQNGSFDWAAPDDELHTFVNNLERPIGTYLYGRRMYETMVYWETTPLAGEPSYVQDYTNIWRAADKIVYSRTLQSVASQRTRIERGFNPGGVKRLKAESGRDLSVSGAHLAGQAIRDGLVDEIHLFLVPIVVGGGNRALPNGVRVKLELLDERRFGSGVIHLSYHVI